MLEDLTEDGRLRAAQPRDLPCFWVSRAISSPPRSTSHRPRRPRRPFSIGHHSIAGWTSPPGGDDRDQRAFVRTERRPRHRPAVRWSERRGRASVSSRDGRDRRSTPIRLCFSSSAPRRAYRRLILPSCETRFLASANGGDPWITLLSGWRCLPGCPSLARVAARLPSGLGPPAGRCIRLLAQRRRLARRPHDLAGPEILAEAREVSGGKRRERPLLGPSLVARPRRAACAWSSGRL